MFQDDPAARAKVGAVYADRPRKVLESIDALWATLNDDERLYVQYRRDTECHPWQNAYRLRLDKRGEIKDERTVFGRRWKIEEADSALGKLIRSNGIDESTIAAEFARRISTAMERVFEAGEGWFGGKA